MQGGSSYGEKGSSLPHSLTSAFAISSTNHLPSKLFMVSSVFAATAGLLGAAFLSTTADAHQMVLQPEPTWKTNDKMIKMNPLSFLEGEGFKPYSDFNGWRAENGYKSLRDFLDRAKYSVTPGADQTCGWTDPKGTPQPIPKDGNMRSTGYTHDGPCEVYLDDVLVLGYDNCHEKIMDKAYPIDYSSCEKKGSCTLYWFWLGVRFVKEKWSWQVYKECIPLTAAGGGKAVEGPPQGENGGDKKAWPQQQGNNAKHAGWQPQHLRV